MKLLQLTPGAGERFYCENCLRDASMVRALRSLGVDAMSLPMYLPPVNDLAGSTVQRRVFFGGINVYLQQKWGFFRRCPRWLDRLFDAPWLLRWVGRFGQMTDARQLGEMTLSMLRGEHGRQGKELDRLADHLAGCGLDVIVLSNALLIGLARRLKAVTGASVICWLQDEEGFLDELPEPYRQQAWDELRGRCGDVERFIAPSRYYASRMADRLELSRPPTVLPLGIELGDEPVVPLPETPAVGFLAQFSRPRGLDRLVESLAAVRDRPGLQDVRLIACGGQTVADRPFVQSVRKRVDELHLTDRVELIDRFDADTKRDVLQRVSLVAVPARQPVAAPRWILDAWSAARPVVAADDGGAGELLARTPAGRTIPPDPPDALADALADLLADRDALVRLGRLGRQAVEQHHAIESVARAFLDILPAHHQERPC